MILLSVSDALSGGLLIAAGPAHDSTPAILQDLATIGRAVGLPLVVLAVTFLVSRFASRRLRAALEATGFQLNVAILLARALWLGIWALGVMLSLYFVGVGLTPLAAFIGVVGLAASLSLQQVLQNLVAVIYLLAERPFNIGDFVSVVGPAGLNHEGRVEDIQMRTTHLRSQDDELILVPNSAIFAGVVTNRTAVGGQPAQVTLTFPRSVDPAEAREKILQLLERQVAVLAEPRPDLRVDRATKEDWTASLLFWMTRHQARSDVIWALAHAFPEVTVNDGASPP